MPEFRIHAVITKTTYISKVVEAESIESAEDIAYPDDGKVDLRGIEWDDDGTREEEYVDWVEEVEEER